MSARVLPIVVTAACVSGRWHEYQPEYEPAPGDLSADLVGADAARIENLLRGSVTYGGLWFDDPVCAKQFETVGPVAPDRFHAFAECLAALKLQRSSRADALFGGVVLTYGPGFEIEALFAVENGVHRLSWIGFESRRGLADATPTISMRVLEALRIAGDRNGPIDAELGSQLRKVKTSDDSLAYAWVKVCIDETGSVDGSHVYETTSTFTGAAFATSTTTWKFKPFMIGDRAIPVCAMERMTYPPQTPSKETLPFVLDEKNGAIVIPVTALVRTSEPKLIVPDDLTKYEIAQRRLDRVVGAFRVCIDTAGKVAMVRTVKSTGFRSYDLKILSAITHRWTYKPYIEDGKAVAVCTSVTFYYVQR